MDKPHRLEKKSKSKWESVDSEINPEDLENVIITRSKDKNKQVQSKSVNHYHEDKRDISECVLQSRVSQLEFECLPTWTLVLVNKLPEENYRDEICVNSYLHHRLESRGRPLDERQKGSHEWIARKLSRSSVALYTKQGGGARKELDEAKESVNLMHLEVTSYHRMAYEYLIESLDWSITAFLPDPKPKSVKGKGKGKKWAKEREKAERKRALIAMERNDKKNYLRAEWKKVLNEPKCASALIFVKACLGQLLGEGAELPLKRFKMARDYEPDFYLWHQLIYQQLRKIRKAEGEVVPWEDEIKACENAYQLCGSRGQVQGWPNVQVTFDWAMMRKERFRQRRYASEQEAAEIVQLFRDVICGSSSSEVINITAHISMAEMYTFREANLDAEEGNRIFLECISKYPKDSHVLHKVGKFYHYGLAGGRFQNPKKAKEMFSVALNRSPSNYPCLMDYMKLLGKKDKAYNQIIDLIDKYRNYQNGNQGRMTFLLTIRGLCYWMRGGGDGGDRPEKEDKRKAIEDWLDAVIRYPTKWSQVTNMITAKENEILGPLDINLKQVLPQIRKICKKEGVPRKDSVDNFYSTIESKLN